MQDILYISGRIRYLTDLLRERDPDNIKIEVTEGMQVIFNSLEGWVNANPTRAISHMQNLQHELDFQLNKKDIV